MKLLVETALSDTFNVLEEAEGKSLHIEGIFIQTNIRNINGRIYPKETVRGEVERYIKEVVDNNRALGELNHPKDPTLNPERACIKIVSLKESGDNYIGKAKVLQHTPMGAIVAGLLRDGVQLGVSSRALGSVRKGFPPDFGSRCGIRTVCAGCLCYRLNGISRMGLPKRRIGRSNRRHEGYHK